MALFYRNLAVNSTHKIAASWHTTEKGGIAMQNKDRIPYLVPNDPYGKFAVLASEMDPDGMYTGVPKEFRDMPVQDADDL